MASKSTKIALMLPLPEAFLWYNELMDNDVLKSNQEQMEKDKQMFRETEKQNTQKSLEEKTKNDNTGIATKDNVIKPDSNQTEKSQNVMVKEVDTIKTNDDQLKKIKTRAKAALVISIIVFVFVVVITVPLFRCLKPCQGSDCNVCSTGFGIILPFEMQPGILLSIIAFILISKTSDKLKKYERSPEIDKIKKYCTISRNLLYFSGIFIVVLYCLYFLISVGAKIA